MNKITDPHWGGALYHPLFAVEGGAAGLGPFRVELNELYWEWEWDPRVLVGYGRQSPLFREEREEVYHRQTKDSDDRLLFTIWDLTGEEPQPVGITGMTLTHKERVGKLFIQIGVAQARGRGVGTEAVRLMLDYGFHVTNLGCVYLMAYEPNGAAIRSYEKAGFKRMGVRRSSGYWMGQRVAQVHMDAVPEDFVGVSAVKKAVNG